MINTYTPTYPAVAHGALGWDTQLRNDVNGVANVANLLTGTGQLTPFGYANTAVDYGAGFVTRFQASGNLVTFNLAANPGSGGFNATSATTIGTLPVGTSPLLFRPGQKVVMPVLVIGGSGPAGMGAVIIDTGGLVYVTYLPIASVPAGGGLLGTASWPMQ